MRDQLPEVERYAAWVDCTDSCDDPAMHAFYAGGGGFRWWWPRFNMPRPADRRTRAGLNRYPHNVIGAYVVVFGRTLHVRWKGTRRG